MICVFRSLHQQEVEHIDSLVDKEKDKDKTVVNTLSNSKLNTDIRATLTPATSLNVGIGLGSGTTTVESNTPHRKSSTINASDIDENYCLRALQCACELRKRENKHLACHIAVTVGEIKFGILGGFNDEWSYIANGSCLSELSTCITDAKPKQVVCSKACYDYATGVPYDSTAQYEPVDTFIPTMNRRENLVNGELCDTKSGNYLINSVISSKYQVGRKKRNSSSQIIPFVISSDTMSNSTILQNSGNVSNSMNPNVSVTSTSVSNSNLNSISNSNSNSNTIMNSNEIGAMDSGISMGISFASAAAAPATFELTSRVLEAAEYFVPRPALSAIYSGSLDNISELRQVTTMFLHLDSYSPVIHVDPISLQPFFYLLQQILDETGGFLRQFLVDDKVRTDTSTHRDRMRQTHTYMHTHTHTHTDM